MGDLSLGKIQAALASATSEVTIAAANINFDFAVFKYDAPAEYQPLSTALTSQRRENAEFGDIHVTARRLATLFEGVCPSTPKLLKAYGTRASQICRTEDGISAKSKSSLFGQYLGVDATSIWAAATSSRSGSAVHIHLLACLLARIWSHSEAVSIWDQIVSCRREEITHKFMDSGNLPFSTLSAATQQTITLSSLAAWDASARAWLNTADAAMVKEQTQFFLICKNLTMPVNENGRLYDSIISAWICGLQTLERLINGAPHTIRDGSVLLAISAWHIYPNMMVFGVEKSAASTEVLMQDDLVAEGGTISVGLSRIERGDLNSEYLKECGVYWSMPLDRLRHYGKSVRRTRNLLDDARRMPFTDLLQVNLGAVLAEWQVPPRSRLEFVDGIIKIITLSASTRPSPLNKWADMILEPCFDYLQDTIKSDALLDLGSRRPDFIRVDIGMNESHEGHGWPILFGLCNILAVQSLLIGKAERIRFLLYIFSQRFPNISGAVILGGPEKIGVSRSHQKLRFWSTQLHRHQSPENTRGVQIQEGALDVPRFKVLQQDTVELPSSFRHDNGVDYVLLVGDPATAAIYVRTDAFGRNPEFQTSANRDLSIHDLKWFFDWELISCELLAQFLSRETPWSRQLKFLHKLSNIYNDESMKDSTISCRVFERPLLRPWQQRRALHPWVPDDSEVHDDENSNISKIQELATLCYLETGSHGVQTLPDSTLRAIIAFSVGDSIFVRSEVSPLVMSYLRTFRRQAPNHQLRANHICIQLVQDPWTGRQESQDSAHPGFTRLLGNIGKPGLTLLTTPSDLLVAERDPGTWKMANYAPFNGEFIDCFSRTSLHLTVLDWSLPVSDDKSYGQLTTEVHLAEAVVSVHDSGAWVGDVDLLTSLASVTRVRAECSRGHQLPVGDNEKLGAGSSSTSSASSSCVVSLDSWDEVLDPPMNGVSFVRARGNWVARLAVIGILKSRRRNTAVCPESSSEHCWQCLKVLSGDASRIFIL